MIRQEQLAVIIDAQHSIFLKKQDELIRETLDAVPILENYATIITGIRRCGKSTLLLQLLRTRYEAALYINFEDIRLVGFDASDFTRLHNEIVRRKLDVLFFDEIQLASHWEVFVHQLLREGYTVFVTGSNELTFVILRGNGFVSFAIRLSSETTSLNFPSAIVKLLFNVTCGGIKA